MATVRHSTEDQDRDADEEPSLRATHERHRSTLFFLVVAVTLLPLAATVASIARVPWHPVSDIALEVLRIGDVGGRHTPLVGVYSRFGWSHPGPALFWVLAPFRWLLGRTGVLLGVAVLNAAAITGALVLSRRRGGVPFAMLTGLVVLLLMQGLGTDLLVDPWNPWVPVLPFLAYLLLAWSVAERDLITLPWLVGVGSFVVQLHIGYAPLVAGTAVAAGVLAWRRRTDTASSWSATRAVAVAGVVGLALWLPAIVQQFTGHPGNLGEIISYFRHPTVPVAGWRSSFGMMGRELGVGFPWVTRNETNAFGTVATASTIPAFVSLALAAALACGAARRGARNTLTFALLVIVTAVLGIVAGSRVDGFAYPYLVRWWWAIAACVSLSIGWSALSLVMRTRFAAVAAGVIAVAGVGLAVATTLDAVPARVPQQPFSRTLAHLTPAVARKLARNHEYIVRWVGPRDLGAVGVGMFLDLEDRGFAVRVLRDDSRPFGSWRAAEASASVSSSKNAVTVVAIADEGKVWTAPRDAVLLARYDSLTPPQRRRARALERAVRADLPAHLRALPLPVDTDFGRGLLVGEGANATAVSKLYALQRRDQGYSVYLTSPSA